MLPLLPGAAIASGYCLTFTVSARPVALFAPLPTATYGPTDLLRLRGVLPPLRVAAAVLLADLVGVGTGVDRDAVVDLDLFRMVSSRTPGPPGVFA